MTLSHKDYNPYILMVIFIALKGDNVNNSNNNPTIKL
ncbi:hypothetical protein ING2E5B_1308 [Fermentimonas caenicola]|uniref:Uncharacterized protein n=1 Tax=Fermentimonas caenicola TaxID=1562970 RepID=A0A098C0X4_9BACT|nr:hypothetical protein ING2E5B_1308 [Fermentimonas caenicola]